MPQRDRDIVALRLAGSGRLPAGLQTIAAQFDISHQRVSQILRKTLDQCVRCGVRQKQGSPQCARRLVSPPGMSPDSGPASASGRPNPGRCATSQRFTCASSPKCGPASRPGPRAKNAFNAGAALENIARALESWLAGRASKVGVARSP